MLSCYRHRGIFFSWCSHTLKCVSISGLECVFGNKISDIYDCPIEVSNGYEYEESFAKKMMGISGAAYTSKPNECLKNIIHGATVSFFFLKTVKK